MAVLIVSYRNPEDVLKCLRALERSTYADISVFVWENGGADAQALLADRLAAESLSRATPRIGGDGRNLGFAGGVNACLDLAGPADAYWILNPDTEPFPDALEALVRRLGRGDCDAVGHDLILPEGVLASRSGRWLKWGARAISIDHGVPRTVIAPGPVEAQMNYLIGASLLVSTEFINRFGCMRDDYFLYCEEVEWFLRAKRQGARLAYANDAVVLHAHGATTGGGGELKGRSKISVYLIERNRLLLTWDLYPFILPVAAVVALLHLSFKYAKGGAYRQLGYALSGWLAGLRNERGRPAWF